MFLWPSLRAIPLLSTLTACAAPDDRPALRVETRFGDYGGMDRVVAWLDACGGKWVDAVR